MLVPEYRLPPAESGEDSVEVLGKLAVPTSLEFEPVGRWYESYSRRRHSKQSLSHGSIVSSSSEDEENDAVADDFDDDKDDTKLLQKLDPKEWKSQDHYAVLGLSRLRYRATEDQIKRAYKQKVLKHHPDKRKARGIPVKEGEEDYFTCITRAYETLGVKSKRRAFDSVDPTFDDSIPPLSAESKEKFYELFSRAFEGNARWSTKRGVPLLGDDKTSYDDVNSFYSFWYEFESWRDYAYLDEEEKEKGENRDERRWIEKQNKAARQKRKKEEVARIRQLVDNAWACDPRIQRFKTEEKEKKMAEKKARQDAVRQKAEQEEQRKKKEQEEERLKKEKEDEAAKIQAAAVKKEKEAQKKVLKQERKMFRTAMKERNYFSPEGAERVQAMQDVDKLAELLSAASLQSLNKELSSGSEDRAREAFKQQVREMKEESEREMQKQLAAQRQGGATGGGGDGSKVKNNWSEAEIQMLIKAVNLFPAGTNARWDTINNFLKLHVPESNRTAKEVLAKAKDLQKNDTTLKDEANKKAFEKFTQQQQTSTVSATSTDTLEASQRYESAAETLVYEVGSNPAPWTADEQKLLEQAMRTYPTTVAERWDRIAECLPARSKKDCMKRYKELVELIRSKKLAQAQAASASKKK